jgi:hypothetical protein
LGLNFGGEFFKQFASEGDVLGFARLDAAPGKAVLAGSRDAGGTPDH